MDELITITPISPTNFEFQEYSINDNLLISSQEVETSFNNQTDYIEYYVFDLNGNTLIENVNGYPNYKLINNNVSIDPLKDLTIYGYDQGSYNTLYNFLRRKLGSTPYSTYYIAEISSDRTEVRLNTTDILNGEVVTLTNEFISEIQSTPLEYIDFYLNFGDNQLVIANNILLDNSNITDPTILIKLYEPLPDQFYINSQCWVVEKIASSLAYYISIINTFNNEDNNIYLNNPNFNLLISNEINNSTNYTNYTTLSSTTASLSLGTGSLQYQLNNLLAQKGLSINVDYSNYNNFIHFSSAQTRIENFYYKLQLLENYTYSSSLSNNSSSGSYYVSSSNIVWQNKIDSIITTFDSYEYYLYYTSGSTSWPKTSITPPYTNYTTTSIPGSTWFVSQSLVAEEYDIENNNALTLAIPSYIIEDQDNYNFELFVEMIGQSFDSIFVYFQDVTNKYNADNRLNYGVSKDLVADILRDMGIKIYQNNFSSNDLYQALIGITPSGNLYNLPFTTNQFPVPTGSFLEYITTYVTASSTSSLAPTDGINKEQYKRIYHNLPLLLKKKGSVAGLRNLITTFGITDTILRINEFGGKDKNPNSYDNWENTYNYNFYTSGSAFITSSFVLNSTWGSTNNRPSSVEFRFKTDALPQNTSSVASQSLWSTDTGVNLKLRYIGSGYISGSYSGSIIDPYYQYALLDFIPDTGSLSISASIYLPFYNEGWWSVLINSGSNGFTLYAANKNYKGEDGNTIGFQASSSIIGNNNWSTSTISTFASSSNKIFTGSLQEIRYYTQPISQSNFDAYVMNPYSIESSEYLAFRASLGGELYTSSISIHPKITGSWVNTSSFASTSTFYTSSGGTYESNTEIFYFDQVPSGIQNAISNKIKQQNIVLPYSSSLDNIPNADVLSPFRSIQQSFPISSSYTKNIDYVEVAFSPQNEINEDINSQIGYFNLGEIIGDPRFQSSSLDTYPALDAIRDSYFQKYISNYHEWDYIRLIEFFDNSLFKMLQDWVPARTSLAAGIVIKQTLLERNRYRPPQVRPLASIAWVGSGSTNIPYTVEDQTITGSIDVGNIEGTNGGTMPNLFGQTSSIFIYPGAVNITQSWSGATPSLSGSVAFIQTNQSEFFNGELSGSNLVVTTGKLTDYEVITPQVYSTSPIPVAYTSPTGFFNAGVDYGWPRVSSSVAGFIPSDVNINFDFEFEKTYYLNFTAVITGSIPVGGYNMVIVNSNLTFINGVSSGSYSGAINLSTTSTVIQDYEVQGILPKIFFLNIDGGGSVIPINLYNFTVKESVLSNPDGYVMANDAQVERVSSKYMEVDFNQSITASNSAAILGGYAYPASVQDSNYTTARVINPRYNGSKTISPTGSIYEGFVNQPMIMGSSIGALANVEQYCNWFAYFNGVQNTTYTYYDPIGSAFVNTPIYTVYITTLIDVFGNMINLDSSNNIIPISGSIVINPLSGSALQNPLLGNIPIVQSIFPATSQASLKQYTNATGSATSGSFNPFTILTSGFSPNYASSPYYFNPNENIVVLNYSLVNILPNSSTPGLLIPQNFNPNYKSTLLQIAQKAGFFKNI